MKFDLLIGGQEVKLAIINLLLTEREGRTGEYWRSVVFVRTSLRSVRTATTSGQYSPARPSRSVSKRLIIVNKLIVNS